MPIAAMSRSVRLAAAKASVATPPCEAHISVGECSTHPGCGKICPNGRCAIDTTSPAAPTTMALELVVPWSNARMYFDKVTLLHFIAGDRASVPLPQNDLSNFTLSAFFLVQHRILVVVQFRLMKFIMRLLWPGNMHLLNDKS